MRVPLILVKASAAATCAAVTVEDVYMCGRSSFRHYAFHVIRFILTDVGKWDEGRFPGAGRRVYVCGTVGLGSLSLGLVRGGSFRLCRCGW